MFRSYSQYDDLDVPRETVLAILQDDIKHCVNQNLLNIAILVNRETNAIYKQMYELLGICICTFHDKLLTLHDLAVYWELADDYITEYICRQLINIFAPEQFDLYLRASYFSDKAKFNQLKYIQNHCMVSHLSPFYKTQTKGIDQLFLKRSDFYIFSRS